MLPSLNSASKPLCSRHRTRAGRLTGTLALVLPFFVSVFLARSALAQAPLSLTGTVSPRQVSTAGTLTYTASASGGDPATIRYAFFRRRPGGVWTPDINAPTWQSSNTYSWQPSLSDVGTWETYIWVKDGNTPANMNTYGYAAGYNTMPIEVFGPPTAPGPTTVGCAYSANGECWVTGDFTASVSASTGGLGSLSYQICRSVDSSGGFAGCDVNLTLSGGTSILVSGSHLPADGYRRAYYFQSRDSAGAYSGWNTPLFVRIDRYAPSVGASNASESWYSYRTATVAASDSGSGLQALRYSWGSPLDGNCTTGTGTSSGATLTAPNGDNYLYLCARDNSGRVGQWSGHYRVSPLGLSAAITPNRASYLGSFTWTASASGGTPGTTRYAFFRRRPGGTWIPDVNNPTWQAGTTYTWTPALADAGTWETYVWAKDGDTPASQNTYGYAAGVNTMPIEVVGKPTVPGATTVACAYSVAASSDCWVTGDFTASVTASSGGMGALAYEICRSVDSAGGFAGCDVSLTLNGGTSILVSAAGLPADGFRRAYYFQTRDSAGALSGWNTPSYVRVDRYAPAVSASNASDLWFPSRTATVAAGDTTGGAGANSGLQGVRYSWNTALDGACSNGTATSSGAPLTAPTGDNLLYLCARDNTGRVAQWSGRYRITPPLTLTGSIAPSRGSYLGGFTYTATPSGGDPATLRYAFFHRVPGGTWVPDVNNPNWQADNSYTWSPAATDAGTWETYIWVKDGNTPANQNTYGYAAGYNTMPIEVVGKPTVPGPTTVACAYATADDCWVTGGFTESVSASTGGMGSLVYQICRSNDVTGSGGCEANLTLAGGTSIAVSGADLPGDGYRRAYYFQAKDSAGALSGWNTPRYVRVDRNPPTISATNASASWFSSRTATISASDSTGGAGANSGVQAIRYAWNTALDAGCTTGTATSSGATLTAPGGDNLLYLCARDNTGRVAQWSGAYRISPMGLTGSVSPTRGSYLGSFTWSMTATGGNPATTSFAFFRRPPGGTWYPPVTAPVWQVSGTYTWSPTLSDVGTWETYVWVKDGDTPADANTYGYAGGLNTGPIEVLGKPTVPGATTTSCAYTSSAGDCWVAGDFTAGVTPSSGGMGSLAYQICRSVDSTGGFAGCDVNLTLSGGSSIAVTGAHLPADGYRRAYYFQAQDSAGALSGWNTPLFVRVDRFAPAVSASNASDQWFTSREATLSATDDTGGAAANSGLLELRYRWNTALATACTDGTVASPGTTLSVPEGDNLLYLCARDRAGRVAQWSGPYRVASTPPPEATGATPSVIHQGEVTLLTVTGTNLQNASVYIATESPDDSVDPLPPAQGFAVGIEPTLQLDGFPIAELVDVNPEGTQLRVQIDASEAGIDGFFNLAIETPGGKTGQPFRVVGTMPVIDIFTPSQPVQGSVHVFMVGGANLQGAEVVPLDPAIKVLDLDNSDDTGLVGLLYVDSDAAIGTYDVRIDRPGGESVTLSLDVVGSLAAATLTTQKIAIPGRSGQADVPDILLQQPVSQFQLNGASLQRLGLPANGLATKMAPTPGPTGWQFCFWVSQHQGWHVNRVLLALTDLFGKPLTRQALNRLLPGQRLDFNSTTVAVSANLDFTFFFKICDNWVTTVIYCVKASISYMVPLVGGYAIEFNACNGTQGPRVTLTPDGLIVRHEWSATSSCVAVTDDDPESQSGERSGKIAVNCCTPADIHLHTTGEAFDQTFDAQGKVASVQQENCEELPPPELRVILDVGDDNIPFDEQNQPMLEYEYLPSELDDSAAYLPCSPLGAGTAPPGQGVLPSQLPQRVSLVAAYVQAVNGRLRIVQPPADVTSVEIELQGTSTLSGIATNYPAEGSGGSGSGYTDPDLWLGALGDTSGERTQLLTVNFGAPGAPSPLARANLYCNDYGGSTKMRVRPSNGVFSAPLPLPLTPFGSKLPSIGWTAMSNEQVQAGSLQDTTDSDGTPVGAAAGDGLSAFSEYRGVVVNGTHYRLNPEQKDVFVQWDSSFGSLGGMSQLDLRIHRPLESEVYKVANQPGAPDTLWMNVNGAAIGMENDAVAVIQLTTDTTPAPTTGGFDLGVTRGEVRSHGPVVSTLYSSRVQGEAGPNLSASGLRDWVVSHELGHAVDICHREEDAAGNPVGICNDGATIDPRAVIPNDVYYMHSGTIFDRIKNSTNTHAGPAQSYHPNSHAQVRLK